MSRTYFIAEMSCNHLGSLDRARDIVKAAKECGADAIKLQTDRVDYETVDCKSDVFMIKGGTLWDGRYLADLYEEVITPWEWHEELRDYAKEIEIDLFSTPCAPIAVDFLENLDMPCYKISSFEAVDIPLIEYTASKMKPMLISVGILNKEEIWEAVNACRKVGNEDITLLKCTSSYPAKLENMNLLTITDLINEFGVKVGLSDHTLNVEASIIAVTLGATVVEKHFTLDRKLGGADAEFSINPTELKETVQAIRNTEKLLGKVSYDYDPNNRMFARSLFVIKDIKQGEIFTHDNLRSVRPGDGLPPKMLTEIIGMKASKNLIKGIRWSNFPDKNKINLRWTLNS